MSLSTAQIKVALRRARTPQRQIARVLGYSEGLVSHVVCGLRRHAEIEGAIARAIGREPEETFPVIPVRVPPPRPRRRATKGERAA